MKKMIMASLAVLMLASLAACHQEPKKPVTLGGTAAGWSRSGTSTSLQGSGTCQYSASACQSCLAAPPRGDTGNCTAYCKPC